MKSSTVYILIIVVSLLATVGIVVNKQVPRDELQAFFTSGTIPPSLIPKPRTVVRRSQEESDAQLELEQQVLEPVNLRNDNWEAVIEQAGRIPRIKQIPWERGDIEFALRAFPAGRCQILPTGSDVAPLGVEAGEPGESYLSVRKTAFVIGLQVDAAARRTLPNVSASMIEDYLARHAVAIQSTVFQHQNGMMTMAGPIYAAFSTRSGANLTLKPEPMVDDAIGNLAILGALPNDDPNDHSARTVALAFGYDRAVASNLATSTGKIRDYELLFLHLLPESENQGLTSGPAIAAFATTDGRETFQEIELSVAVPGKLLPDVMAMIRFDQFRLMGTYPANPVVTAVRNRVRFSASTQSVRQRLIGGNGNSPISFQKLLDELHRSSNLASVSGFESN